MRRQQQAFTLIELIMVVVIMAILAAMAVPAFNRMIQSSRSLAVGEEFVVGVNTARSEAVGRSRDAWFCASSNGTSCGGAWTSGWIVLTTDSQGNDEVLRSWRPSDLPDDTTITSSDTSIQFTSTGMQPRGSDVVTTTLSVAGCGGETGQVVSVSGAGMVSAERTSAPCD